MVGALTIIGGLFLILLETVLLRVFGVMIWAPQITVVLVVYVALRRSFSLGALATLLYSGVADLCWGGPRGYYAFGLAVTFLAATLVRVRWQPKTVWAALAVAIPSVVLTDVASLTALALFRRGQSPLEALVLVSPLAALWTGVFAIPLYWFFGRIDRLLEHREHQGVAIG
jgi:rod shape-determining protein MreD